MTTKDWLEASFSYANWGIQTVQFFVIASVAIGGWLASSDTISKTHAFSQQRWVWVGIYTIVPLICLPVIIRVRRRFNACIRLAIKTNVEYDITSDNDFRFAFEELHVGFIFGLLILAIVVDFMILTAWF